ncbi:cytochrome P450 [Mycena rebaudengoi]|nr:cytochrome P450 [Mycena rebaudengoi]
MLAIGTTIWGLLVLAVSYYGIRWTRNRSKLPLPPGPRKLPLVGNLFDIPAERQWEKYLEWSKEFNSDIIHLNVAGTSIVVLSSVEAIRDLFDKRSSLYSDRARLPMINELMGWDFSMGFMKYGDLWRSHRKMVHDAFNIRAVKQFNPQERAVTHAVLRRILERPTDIMEHFRHLAGALIMSVTYGIEVVPYNDPYITLARDAMHGVAIASIPGTFLVDTIPALKYVPSWFPGATFKRRSKQWRNLTLKLLEIPYIDAKRCIATGTAPSSYTSVTLDALDESKHDPEEYDTNVKATAANMYAAGADTTVSALGSFVLAMLAYPEVQYKAQAELDSVIGMGNLPDFPDEASLPYVTALVKEVLRWRNVTPIAIPHFLAVDDEYRGYRIPAGTIVIGNAWAILHDENAYSDPQSFKPERFLLDGKLNPNIRDPDTAAFGFGRRICPGRHMAYSSIWITLASMLSTLNIAKVVKDGKVVEPSYEYFPGLISTPLPFECSITPRSQHAKEVIQATAGGE